MTRPGFETAEDRLDGRSGPFPFAPQPGNPIALTAAAGQRLAVGAAGRFEQEMELGRGFLWLPVLFGSGILVYFGLPREPSLIALALPTIALAALAGFARARAAGFRMLVAVAAVLAGTTVAKLRTELVAAPVIPQEDAYRLTGWVEEYSRSGNTGARLVIRVAAIEGLTPEETPFRVRVTARAGAAGFTVGDGIAVFARLQPPQPPVLPGGYDFGRAQYYEGLGGTGYSYGAPKPAEIGPPPVSIALREPLERLRRSIGARIEAAVPGEHGRIANALVTGERGGISDGSEEALRESGLAHILSISGLHMALVAGVTVWTLWALLALSQSLALRRPIKKWAAAGGLLVTTFYLLISGAEVATQRSYIMIAVMLTAVLLDRRAFSVRNVALAALLVLLIAPDAILSAGFQMSFAATLALVAGFEAVAAWRRRRIVIRSERAERNRVLRYVAAWVVGAMLTSLLAGLATTPFSAFHFQRTAPLSLLANVAAAPAISILVMPGLLAAVLLMPLGLEGAGLWFVDHGIAAVLAIGTTVADWSSGAGTLRAAPLASLLLVAFGLCWICLWGQRWRRLGVVPILLGVALAGTGPRPQILIASDGEAVAVRADDGTYRILGGRSSSFDIETWLRADADPRGVRDDSLRAGVHCDRLGCTTVGGDGVRVALTQDPRGFDEDCRLAAVVVTRLRAPDRCRETATVVDRSDLENGGAHAFRIIAAAIPAYRIETSRPEVRRAWMPPPASGVARQ